MPKRSSSDHDEVTAAFDVLQHVINTTEGRPASVEDLRRLCAEVRDFAKVARLPTRVILALDNAAHGRPVGPSLLPITPDDFKEPNESPAVALGRAGGLKGGRARADALSGRRRSAIAKKAAQARWRKPKRS